MTRSAPNAVDTSIIVAAFAGWHERHDDAAAILDEGPSAAAHSLLESYSVLTRLPAPFRMPAGAVSEFLDRSFPAPMRLTLPDEVQIGVVARLADLGIAGGAAYDALIAFTVAAAGATLSTFDERASATYRRCGIELALPGGS